MSYAHYILHNLQGFCNASFCQLCIRLACSWFLLTEDDSSGFCADFEDVHTYFRVYKLDPDSAFLCPTPPLTTTTTTVSPNVAASPTTVSPNVTASPIKVSHNVTASPIMSSIEYSTTTSPDSADTGRILCKLYGFKPIKN